MFPTEIQTLNTLAVDDEKILSYFEAWAAKHGNMYLTWMRDRLAECPIDMNDRTAVKEMLPVSMIGVRESTLLEVFYVMSGGKRRKCLSICNTERRSDQKRAILK